MKITFLGVGSAFTTKDYYQSNIMVTSQSKKRLLIDCGSDIRFALGEYFNKEVFDNFELIDSIYISHLHADHIGGMEWLAFNTYFKPNFEKIKLYIEENHLNNLWDHSLKGGLFRIQGKKMLISDYFNCFPIMENSTFIWENIEFTLIKMPHIISEDENHFSFGLLIKEKHMSGSVFISSDTQFDHDILSKISETATLIFHDCETLPSKTIIHANYTDLCTLPKEVKEKTWLYHYNPGIEINSKKDGFLGFVKKGQEFVF